MRPQLLDLFGCSGVGAEGYHAAGFDVTGVDIDRQPHYPYRFYHLNALDVLADIEFCRTFDAIHASPPCQHYSDLAKRNGNAHEWPDLVGPVRRHLQTIGRPYVVENVEGAPLVNPVMLCGTMFPGLRVLRHRLFETNWTLTAPPHGKHPLVFTHDKRKAHYGQLDQDTSFVQVTGGGNCTMVNARSAMGLPPDDRRTKHEINEAIPPAYTEHIGRQLLEIL